MNWAPRLELIRLARIGSLWNNKGRILSHWKVAGVRMSAERHIHLLQLSPHLVASDDELHSVASRIFDAGPVRSVTVDVRRTTATVRLKPGTHSRAEFDSHTATLEESLIGPIGSDVPPIELVSWTNSRDQSISFIRVPARVRGWRRAFYLMFAAITLFLGMLGIILPGLPTTPFVLLGSYCLLQSSPRLHERLIKSRVFGAVLQDWYVHRGLRPHVRARAVAVVALVVAASLALAKPPLPVALAIGALAACGLLVIWRLPSVTEGRGPNTPE